MKILIDECVPRKLKAALAGVASANKRDVPMLYSMGILSGHDDPIIQRRRNRHPRP